MEKVLITFGLLFIVAMPCYADSLDKIDCDDGNCLLSKCSTLLNAADNIPTTRKDSSVMAYQLAFCAGLMQGITNMNKTYELMLKGDALFCTPEGGITNGQAARVVVKYLKDHPEKLHENESTLAIKAFIQAYPCK